MKKRLFILIYLLMAVTAYPQTENQCSDSVILREISENRPMKGAVIPDDIGLRLGASHVGGKYYFSQKPFIIEGCQRLIDLGFRNVKLWFRKNPKGYPYHSHWDLPKDITLRELAQYPYYKKCFDMPFATIALSIGGAGINTTNETAAAEEKEIYELTKYLLTQYRNRDVTFILQNWEGDWILRGGTGNTARWSRKSGKLILAPGGNRHSVPVPADSMKRINALIKWFKARQAGVERARSEVRNTHCRVFHAIEANKVMDSMNGIPGIANYVLPKVKTDMVSWSCYDGLTDDGINLYKGIEYLRNQMRPTKYMKGRHVVFLGEIGIPEQLHKGLTQKKLITERWDIDIGVCLALNVPYIFQWELYDNEPKNRAYRKVFYPPRKTDEMRGLWLIRPDGTKSFVCQYFEKLLNHAGGKLGNS